MGTKNKPGDFDCYAHADPDEPMFILLARDESAPGLVREWVRLRAERKGLRHHDQKAIEALGCARAMEEWALSEVGRRARAVLDKGEQEPERCPKCKSDDPSVCRYQASYVPTVPHPHGGLAEGCCPDPWHGEQKGDEG